MRYPGWIVIKLKGIDANMLSLHTREQIKLNRIYREPPPNVNNEI